MIKKSLMILAFVSLIGCSDSDDERRYNFPVVDGATWKYYRVWAQEIPDSGMIDTIAIDVSTVSLTFYPVFYQYTDVFELKVSTENLFPGLINDSFYTSVWYQNSKNDLREIAYYNAGNPVVYPKSNYEFLRHFRLSPLLGSFDFQSTESDTFFRNRVVLNYPFTIGKKWTSFTDSWRSECRITDKKITLTPYGSYNAYEIEHINWDFEGNDTSFVFYSYYAGPGLIKRFMSFDEPEIPTKKKIQSKNNRFLETIELIEYRITKE